MLNEARAIARALAGVQATLGWLEARGVSKETVLNIIDIAEAAGRDVSEGEIIQVLDATDTQLLNLRQKIAMERGVGIFEVTPEELTAEKAKDDAPEPAPEKDDKPAEPSSDEIKAKLEALTADAKTPSKKK